MIGFPLHTVSSKFFVDRRDIFIWTGWRDKNFAKIIFAVINPTVIAKKAKNGILQGQPTVFEDARPEEKEYFIRKNFRFTVTLTIKC
jgi:hypothetical protein